MLFSQIFIIFGVMRHILVLIPPGDNGFLFFDLDLPYQLTEGAVIHIMDIVDINTVSPENKHFVENSLHTVESIEFGKDEAGFYIEAVIDSILKEN